MIQKETELQRLKWRKRNDK